MLTERDIGRIWFGCGNFGGMGSSPNLRHAGDSEEQALQLLDHARRVGLRRFDTANTYGGGASELVLGRWLRSQGPSFVQSAQIATKVGNPRPERRRSAGHRSRITSMCPYAAWGSTGSISITFTSSTA